MKRQVIRLLFVPREPYPTDRVRINVLFGSEMLARGHEIDLIMQAASEAVPLGARNWFGRTVWVGRTDDKDGFYHRLHKHWLNLLHDLRSLQRATRARYDILLISDKFLLAAVAVLYARTRRLKFIFWLTFPYPEVELLSAQTGVARYPWLARIRGRISGAVLYKWILPLSGHVFVQSDRMMRDICARGIDPVKVSPIVTGFSLTDIVPAKIDAHIRSSSSVVLAYLGTLSANRHLEVLVDMLAYLRRDGMDAKLLLIGHADRPRDRAALERHAVSLGLAQHIEITGALPQPQALSRIVTADICLSPIHRSPVFDVGSPTKLIEYLALGMPVIANDHPEQRLILHESRAGVCTPWGARHFARGVRWLMKRSAAERTAMGARGRVWVEANRTYRKIADDVERTCFALVNRRPAQ